MYCVLTFTRANGEAPFEEFTSEVRKSGKRSDLVKIYRYVESLKERGFSLLDIQHMKRIEGDLYELRPKPFRVFVYWRESEGAFYLLNGFRKKSPETPRHEKDRAKQLARGLSGRQQ